MPDKNKAEPNLDKKSAQDAGLKYLAAQQKNGLCSYGSGNDIAMEPSAWAAIAMSGNQEYCQQFVKSLLALQNSDGGWSNDSARLDSDWSTATALLALNYLKSKSLLESGYAKKVDSACAKAERWILDNRTEYYSAAAKFALLFWKGPEHDYERGWPWTQDTFDWVEPTSYVLLGFKYSDKMQNAAVKKTMTLAQDYLLKLTCAPGGWNFGDRNPYGAQNPPDVQSSAMALLALRSRREDPKVKRSIEWLLQKMKKPESVAQMAWGSLALCTYGQPCDDLLNKLTDSQQANGCFSSNLLIQAVACIALEMQQKPELLA